MRGLDGTRKLARIVPEWEPQWCRTIAEYLGYAVGQPNKCICNNRHPAPRASVSLRPVLSDVKNA